MQPVPQQKTKLSIGLVAPSFNYNEEALRRVVTELESRLNCQCVYPKQNTHLYFADTDAARAKILGDYLLNPSIDLILQIRGGYGASRVYPLLKKRLQRHPEFIRKPTIGLSDFTIFLNALAQDFDVPTYHASPLLGRGFFDDYSWKLFESVILDKKNPPQQTLEWLNPSALYRNKALAGPIVGGCLSIVTSTLATDYEINTKNNILFLEDVDEKPYRIDRMLIQLAHAKKLDRVKAIVFGQLEHCEPMSVERDPNQTTAKQAIVDALQSVQFKKPILWGLSAGHGIRQVPIRIGQSVNVRLAKNATLTFGK